MTALFQRILSSYRSSARIYSSTRPQNIEPKMCQKTSYEAMQCAEFLRDSFQIMNLHNISRLHKLLFENYVLQLRPEQDRKLRPHLWHSLLSVNVVIFTTQIDCIAIPLQYRILGDPTFGSATLSIAQSHSRSRLGRVIDLDE